MSVTLRRGERVGVYATWRDDQSYFEFRRLSPRFGVVESVNFYSVRVRFDPGEADTPGVESYSIFHVLPEEAARALDAENRLGDGVGDILDAIAKLSEEDSGG